MARITGDQIVLRKDGTHYYLDGCEVAERAYRRRHPARGESPTLVRSKRQALVSLAVHPDQIAEAAEDAVKRGVPTEFTRDGKPIMESREHKKRYLRAYGYYDRDAGYGDAAPVHHKGEVAPPNPLRQQAARLADRIRRRHESQH